MPAPFQPTTLPITSGLKADEADFQIGTPSASIANNLDFTLDGAVRGRAAARNVDGSAGRLSTLLASYSGLTPLGVVETASGVPFAAYGGLGATYTPSTLWTDLATARWTHTGPVWSARRTTSRGLKVQGRRTGRADPVMVGDARIVGELLGLTQVTTVPTFPLTNIVNGQVDEATTGHGTTNFDAKAQPNCCAAREALVYPTSTNRLKLLLPSGADPGYAEVELAAAGAASSSSPSQPVWMVAGESDSYYVAYVSTTAGRIDVLRADSNGTVTATLALTALGTVSGVCLSWNGATKLCVAYNDTAGAALMSRIVTITSSTVLTDTGLSMNHGAAAASYPLVVGNAVNGQAVLLWVGTTSMIATRRDYTGTTAYTGGFTWRYSTTGATADAAFVPVWATYMSPLFPPAVWHGRTVVGIQTHHARDSAGGTSNNKYSTWMVLDISEAMFNGFGPPSVIATGQVDGSLPASAGSVGLTSATGALSFGIYEGAAFDTQTGIASANAVKITLTASLLSASAVGNTTMFAGATPYMHDGVSTYPAGFVDGYPILDPATVYSAGGATPAGSYSLQAIWEMSTGAGTIIRSAPSNTVTLTAALNNKLTLHVSAPHHTARYLGGGAGAGGADVIVKVYCTVVNPSAGADKYLLVETAVPVIAGLPSGADVLITVSNTTVDTRAEVLYTGGGVLAAEPPPAGDRGIASVGSRVWVADSRAVYPSQLPSGPYALSWSTAGAHTIPMPEGLGEIQGIAALGDKLLVFCFHGVAAVYGPGLDNLGTGSGWSVDVLSYTGVGGTNGGTLCSGRPAVTTSVGVAYRGADKSIWLIDKGTTVTALRSAGAVFDGSTGLVFLKPGAPGSLATHPRLVVHTPGASSYVLDLVDNAWSIWNTLDGPNGEAMGALWVQSSVVGYPVFNYTGTPGADDNTSGTTTTYTMEFKTGLLQPSQASPVGWGRVRGIGVLGKALSAHTLRVVIKGDDGQTTMMDKTSASITTPTNATWPYGSLPDFRTTIQRAGFVTVHLIASPASAEWSALTLWTSAGNEPAPSNLRT